jgi:molybdate transport repressor ModE-like protein
MLTNLRYFLAIASCGSLSAAAKQLKVSQPALTQVIQQLERELGSTLLNREPGGVTLTATGLELSRCATEVIGLIEQTQRQIRTLETEHVGQFTIGCHESLGAYFLPEFLASFLSSEPAIELSLWNATSQEVRQAVLDRKVHFGLVVNPHPHPDLVMVDLFHDAMDLFVESGDGDPHAPLTAAHERLRKGPLIFAGRVAQCQELLGRLAAGQLLPTRLIPCGDLELVKSLVLQRVGVALLPRRVAGYGQQGRLRRLHPELPNFPDTIFLLYRADLHRTRGALCVKDALSRHGQLLAERGDGFTPPSWLK